ncbi:hypothetical protein QCE65_13815 [Staphylococcus aureus]|nr:hypothetical protein [Staphylococcus aureus]
MEQNGEARNGRKKTFNKIIVVWTITTLVAGLTFIFQEVAPVIINDDKYPYLLFESKTSVIIFIITCIITIVLAFIFTSKHVNKLKNEKILLKFSEVLTYVFSVLIVTTLIVSVVSTFVQMNNIDSKSGKVEKIVKKSSERNGEPMQGLIMVDSHNNKFKLVPSEKLENFNVDKGDKVKFDYIDLKNEKLKKDGEIIGYETVSK